MAAIFTTPHVWFVFITLGAGLLIYGARRAHLAKRLKARNWLAALAVAVVLFDALLGAAIFNNPGPDPLYNACKAPLHGEHNGYLAPTPSDAAYMEANATDDPRLLAGIRLEEHEIQRGVSDDPGGAIIADRCGKLGYG